MKKGASAVLVESTIADCETRNSRGGGAYVDQANLTLQGGSRVERCLAPAAVVRRCARLEAQACHSRRRAAAGGGAVGKGLKIRTSADLEIREVVVCPFS